MAITVDQFRKDFPSFADTADYPEAQITFWLAMAAKLVANTRRWGDLIDFGTELFVAHNLVLFRQSQNAVAAGGVPGELVGAIQSDSVDKASIAYDTSGSAEVEAGHWNLSVYGLQFIRLAREVGSGGLQI